jgi:hypothetical protein
MAAHGVPQRCRTPHIAVAAGTVRTVHAQCFQYVVVLSRHQPLTQAAALLTLHV